MKNTYKVYHSHTAFVEMEVGSTAHIGPYINEMSVPDILENIRESEMYAYKVIDIDDDLAKAMVTVNPYAVVAIRNASIQLQAYAISLDVEVFDRIPNVTQGLVDILAKGSPITLERACRSIPEDLFTQEIANKITAFKAGNIEYVPSQYITLKMCERLSYHLPTDIKRIAHKIDEGILIQLIAASPRLIRMIPKKMVQLDLVKAIIDITPKVIRYVKKQTPEMAYYAVNKDIKMLKYVDPKLQDLPLVQMAMDRPGFDPKMVHTAVPETAYMLMADMGVMSMRNMHKKLLGDPNIVFALIERLKDEFDRGQIPNELEYSKTLCKLIMLLPSPMHPYDKVVAVCKQYNLLISKFQKASYFDRLVNEVLINP